MLQVRHENLIEWSLKLISSNNRILAEGALKFDFEPVVYALAVELVRAIECFDHLPCLQNINAYCAICRLYFFTSSCCCRLLILERSIRIYDSTSLIRRELFFLFFFLELLSEMRGRVVRIETAFITIRLTICIEMSLLELLLKTIWNASIESISIEVHLNILWVHIGHHMG